jgi:hypothetical protein
VWSRHRAAHQDATGTAAENSQLARLGELFGDQVFGAGDEVFPGVGLGRLKTRLVPILPIDAAAARVRHSKHAARIEPSQATDAEKRLFRDAVTRIA